MSSPTSSLLIDQRDGVLTLTLNRPDVLNSFNREMATALLAALDAAASDATVRAIVLTGAGRGFCAGQDLAEALPQGDGPMPDIGEIVRRYYNPIIRAIRTIEKPVLCAVNGIAAGAGANLAFACDLTIAADDISFVESFAKLGLIPDTSGTFFVPRLVGTQRATGMFFLAEKMPAVKAKEWGLIWDVAPKAELMATVRAMAARPRPPRRLSRRCSMRCATRARAGAAQRSCCYRQPRTPTPRRARRSEALPRCFGRSAA
jgi:2-(1,2-epoxy-1,2-dihydrophenyl)acetyl-CoA isomerase